MLLFFLGVVLPQFANVFRDFHAKLDPILATFLALSDFLRANGASLAVGALIGAVFLWLVFLPPAGARRLRLRSPPGRRSSAR